MFSFDELVQLAPDVIWLHSTPGAWAAKRATTTIPIVIGIAADLVEQGIVASLARPGGNLTGLEQRTAELVGKRLELLKEAVPTISRVAVLVDPAELAHAHVPSNIAQEAHALGVQLQRVEAGAPPAFEAAFAAIVNGGADALMIMDAVLFAAHRQQLLALALQHRLPTMAYGRHLAEAGSLLAYGTDPRELCQRSAVFVHKILQGATPADLPIERATFQLVVNLKTAEALGLTLSPMFVADMQDFDNENAVFHVSRGCTQRNAGYRDLPGDEPYRPTSTGRRRGTGRRTPGTIGDLCRGVEQSRHGAVR